MVVPLDLRPMQQTGLERGFRTFLGTEVRFLFTIVFHYSLWIL
jgi:hypothetical protein